MTKRLQVLQNSLEKKEAMFNNKLNNHFNSVSEANGQPLNDKKNGSSTVRSWERQNNALRNLNQSIEVTKSAIKNEQELIDNVNSLALPKCIKLLICDGTITQWRKYPNRFFVVGVDKARIILNKDNTLAVQYLSAIPTQEQYAIFRDVVNYLRKELLNEQNT